MVQNRVQVTSLSQFIPYNNGFILQITTQNPHGLRTGNQTTFAGTGWPAVALADTHNGATLQLTGSSNLGTVWVTGANTFVMQWQPIGWSAPATTIATGTTYTLNPSNQYGGDSLPESAGFPYEFIAQATGRIAGADIHVNVPYGASDSCVYEIARRIRDNFPSGRTVWVELANEPWRMPNAMGFFGPISQLMYPSGYMEEFYVIRAGQCWNIFRTVFGARSGEIKGLLNVHQRNLANYAQLLATAESLGISVGAIAIACYIDADGGRYTATPSSMTAYTNWDTQQVIDLWVHDFAYDTTDLVAGRQAIVSALAAHNARTGDNTVLYAYEGGIQTVYPGSVTNALAKTWDATYDPNWYIIEQDLYGIWQSIGYQRFNIYALSMIQVSGDLWGVYRSTDQDHGRGDGSDGKANNRLCLAQPGLPHSKASTTNVDLTNVSVRGQALLNWNGSNTPAPPPTVRRKPRLVFRPFSRSH
jgi:hypothetical protein